MWRALLMLSIAFPLRVAAQQPWPPPIGAIEIFGVRTFPDSFVLAAVPLRVGDTYDGNAAAIEERLRALRNVAEARVSLLCCNGGKSTLYVGIRERGTPAVRFRDAPRRDVRLPEEIARAMVELDVAMERAAQAGDFSDDASRGHSLAGNAGVRQIQERFIDFAERHRARLRDVLLHSKFAEERANAAEVLAYATDKEMVARELGVATRDPDSHVRNNALRALMVLAISGRATDVLAELRLIDFLDSPDWSDRNKATGVLFWMTSRRRDARVLAELRHRAILSLAEMARWDAEHAQPAFFLIGRIGGLSDEEIAALWDARNLRAVLVAAENTRRQR
jgi:hypothetical protein